MEFGGKRFRPMRKLSEILGSDGSKEKVMGERS